VAQNMPLRLSFPCVALLLCLAPADALAGKKEALPPIPGVEVVLTFSTKELDPKKPGDAFVQCVVKNGSKETLSVPSVYTGGWEQDMVLEAHGLRLVYWAGAKNKKHVKLEPGKELVVFKAPLVDVLLLGPDGGKKPKPAEPRFYWSWDK
jgi:hypothetical protein